MNDIFNSTEVQGSRLQYRVAACEEKYKEVQEILETLNNNVSRRLELSI
jgi:alpha-L-fucosidase